MRLTCKTLFAISAVPIVAFVSLLSGGANAQAQTSRPTVLTLESGSVRDISEVTITGDGQIRVVHGDGIAVYPANQIPQAFLSAWGIQASAVTATRDSAAAAVARKAAALKSAAEKATAEKQRTEAAKVGVAQAKAIAVAVAEGHSIALTADGKVWQWGKELESPAYLLKRVPVENGTAIAAGGSDAASNFVVLKTDGTVWKWGFAAIGRGSDISIPIQVSNLADVIAISAGTRHGLALKKDKTVWAWGNKAAVGMIDESSLPEGAAYNFDTAVRVAGLENIVAISAASDFNLALREDGTVWGWGTSWNEGILGDKLKVRPRPEPIGGLSDIAQIAAGVQTCLALRRDGELFQWGLIQKKQEGGSFQFKGQTIQRTGKNLNSNISAPQTVSGLTEVTKIAAGFGRCLALQRNGKVFQWGWEGGLGGRWNGDPIEIPTLARITAIAAGSTSVNEHCLAVRDDGTVWAWGSNFRGQLGNGQSGSINAPAPVRVKGILATQR